MTMRAMRWGLLAAALLGPMAGRAAADRIVDQSNTGNSFSADGVAVNSPIGETFTPTLTSIDFATFDLQNDANSNASFDVQLYSGAGTGGVLLATSGQVTIPGGFGISTFGQAVEFDFASPVALEPGSQYSLILGLVAGSTNLVSINQSDTRTAGSSAIIGGNVNPGFDFDFSEGITTAAVVPEPSSLVLCWIAGMVGLAVVRVRRKRLAA